MSKISIRYEFPFYETIPAIENDGEAEKYCFFLAQFAETFGKAFARQDLPTGLDEEERAAKQNEIIELTEEIQARALAMSMLDKIAPETVHKPRVLLKKERGN